jgi:hypothetical protein
VELLVISRQQNAIGEVVVRSGGSNHPRHSEAFDCLAQASHPWAGLANRRGDRAIPRGRQGARGRLQPGRGVPWPEIPSHLPAVDLYCSCAPWPSQDVLIPQVAPMFPLPRRQGHSVATTLLLRMAICSSVTPPGRLAGTTGRIRTTRPSLCACRWGWTRAGAIRIS